jgi:hypothetical protein
MATPHKEAKEPLPHSMVAISFAEALAESYSHAGGNPSAIFSAFVGLVSAKDEMLCAECLQALEQAISSSSAGS